MLTCTRLLKFDAGHRVMNHESKCRTPHGHEYKLEVTASAQKLDSLGRIIDFGCIKEILGTWIDNNWDHTFIVNKEDKVLIDALLSVPDFAKPIFIFPSNPTAENMAEYLLTEICPVLFSHTGVSINKIRLWETSNCYAEASL